ncbi:stomatin 2 [Oleiphilus sp. HI0009]|nr:MULTISPECIES: stomatin-like protein [unclassified Oleiphilus]KZX75125.1 stomatin 2 [Oleiphilus sp. HI0009]MCH2158738.1 paraslipin [Oleiphilaceae bacterium]KZY68542.1 stomatin 2 [Oleiphilus sp. HI0067]KZY71759.1 stomatin 2 [Oleiphilus sp. HI0066]KZY72904.1 stomatin 2 [Oleiphilus sp. HI0067]
MNIVLEYLFSVQAAVLVAILIVLKLGIKFVPQNRAYIVERFGKYNRTIEAGINMIVPFIDSVAHDRSLKEQAVDVPSQGAITKDNISLTVDGVLYFRVLDPYKASYGVEDYAFAVTQLAQTTMRSEIGKIELDKTFEERDQLNANIVNSINQAAEPWGVQVLRYEIKDIVPPQSVMSSMEAQMRAERERRAKILESEGDRQAEINRAEGEKRAQVLAAEAEKQQQILTAEGEAQAIIRVAEAQAAALQKIGNIAVTNEGSSAIQLELAQKAIAAKEAIAKESSVVLLPDGNTEAASVVAQVLSIADSLKK